MANDPGSPSLAGAPGYGAVNMSELQQLQAAAYGNPNAQANFGQIPGTDTMVYMGKAYERPGRTMPPKFGSPGASTPADTGMRPISYAANEFYSFGETERKIYEAYMLHANGYVPNDISGAGIYANILGAVAQYQTTSGRKIDPFEWMLERIELTDPYSSRSGRGGGGGGPRQVVDLTNPMDAEVLVDQALTQYLGRQATQAELDDFVSTLNRVERKNPVTVSQSGRSGGVNQQLVAEEFARAQPLAAETQAATQYMGWLVDALAADESGGIQSGL